MNKKLRITICLALFHANIALPLFAQEICNPSDPFGDNSNNLCPLHYHGVYGDSFVRAGNGTSAFHGASVDVFNPGSKVISSPLRNDFFTHVQAGGKEGGLTIKTQRGKVFRVVETDTN